MPTHNIPNAWSDILREGSPLLCGILNVTPDSFSDGNQFLSRTACEEHIDELTRSGAHIIDVGAESTRPGAREVSSEEELQRLSATCDALAREDRPLFSIDTRHADTARVAMANGFHIINDVSGATFDPDMAVTMAQTNALCILMHMRGTPETMMEQATYANIVDDISHELEHCVAVAIDAGVRREKIMIDPGIGFAKTPEDNIELVARCPEIKERLGLPMMVGVSRKSVTSYLLSGDKTSATMADRDILTAQFTRELAEAGIDAVRVHDVALSAQALAR